MKVSCIIIFGLLCCILPLVNGYKILFWSVFSAKSHKFVLGTVAEELAKKGHEVVFFNSVKPTKSLVNVKEVYLPEAEAIMNADAFNFFLGGLTSSDYFDHFERALYELADISYSHPFIQDLLSQPRDPKTNAPKYDLLVIDGVFNFNALPLAHHLGVPMIYLSPFLALGTTTWSLNIPFPSSYLNFGTLNVSSPMSFFERALNTYIYLSFNYKLLGGIYPKTDVLIKKYLPNAPKLTLLEKNVSLLITNDHFTIVPSAPTMPYYIRLGGIHLKPTKPLPKDLEDFMQSSGEHGVIYFSLGSYTQGAHMPVEMKDKLSKAFGQLPQKVLWKNEIPIKGLPKNVNVVSWVPQQDLLAHPKLRLFITHGGGLSLTEAVYHGCPLLGFPLSADQSGNMASVINMGYGASLEWTTFTAEELLYTIKAMTTTDRYKERAMEVSVRFKDRPQNPLESAVYWIEYVVRHNGAAHLKSGAEHLNYFQYFLLDIVGVGIAIILFVFVVLIFVLKMLLKFLIGSKQQQKSSKQKKK